ncbi:MAG: VTT domain-containing protein [Actinomycetia bacterium]|nr:VTT domain-containing protein [Actinomycetes bacterium]
MARPPRKPYAQTPAPAPPGLSFTDKIKFVGLIVFFLATIAIGFALFHYLGNFSSNNDDLVASLKQSILDAGFWGILICIGLQLLQVIVAIIPGEVIQAAIGLVYGTVWGGVITLVGVLIASVCVFYLVRALGAPFVQGMLGQKEGKRTALIQRFLDNSKRLNATVFVLYLIPGMPKDIFTYLVPLTPMRAADFFVLSTLARAPAIFATTFVMEAWSSGNYLAMIIVAVIFGGLGIVGIAFNMQIMRLVDRVIDHLHRHQDKDSETSE